MFCHGGAEIDLNYQVMRRKTNYYKARYVPRREQEWDKNILFECPGGDDDNPTCVA